MNIGEDFITVLTCKDKDATAQKTFIVNEHGFIDKKPYNAGYKFIASEFKLNSKQDLYNLVQMLMNDPTSFVIRGRAYALGIPVRRKFKGPDACFTSAKHRWLCIDVDGILYPRNMDVTRDPEEVIFWLKTQLPWQLREAECFYKFSSSQNVPIGMIDQPIQHTLSVHLWFWLGDYYDDRYLEYFMALSNAPADISLFSPVQPHYIAVPAFEGMADPIKQRFGIC